MNEMKCEQDSESGCVTNQKQSDRQNPFHIQVGLWQLSNEKFGIVKIVIDIGKLAFLLLSVAYFIYWVQIYDIIHILCLRSVKYCSMIVAAALRPTIEKASI